MRAERGARALPGAESGAGGERGGGGGKGQEAAPGPLGLAEKREREAVLTVLPGSKNRAGRVPDPGELIPSASGLIGWGRLRSRTSDLQKF